MINANKIYIENNKKGKSPGQWLMLKDTKKLLKLYDFQHTKEEEGDYLFDEQLAFHYEYHLNPLIAHNIKAEVKSDIPEVKPDVDYSDLFKTLFVEISDATIRTNFIQQLEAISNMSIDAMIKNAKGPMQHIISLSKAFDSTLQLRLAGMNQLKNKARSAAQHIPILLFSSGETIFEDSKFEYYINKANVLSKRGKQIWVKYKIKINYF